MSEHTPPDRLFAESPVHADFRFTDQVAEVFDDMLHRSVPNYQQVIGMTASLLGDLLEKGVVYDLGCSTGNTLLALARKLSGKQLSFVGIDNSPAMIEKANRKLATLADPGEVRFILGDITSADLAEAAAVILNYTLQFIRPLERPGFLSRIFEALPPGGVLIMSEKIISKDPVLNRRFIDAHHQFKREQGYSELEIARKREALEHVLIPFSIDENQQLLRQAGFRSVETFHQWFNFASWVAVK